MGTLYSVVLETFYHRVEKDRDFFDYFGLTADESMAIAKQRALGYMDEAVARIALECQLSTDFISKDDISEIFTTSLSSIEIFLISSLMYQSHLERDMAYLKTLNVNYTSTELRVFDPSNARSTFMQMYDTVCEQNEALMDKYRSLDRNTGTYKVVDFSAYDE